MNNINVEPTGPLSGFRVVEMTSNASGPYCGMILGDLGAEVIKIEPVAGEVTRYVPPFYKGESGQFAQWNRNKQSIGINMKSPEGLEIARKLIRTADVFLENARPGVAASLGIGYETLKAENPKLIFLSINGFGNSGPYKDLPAYDPVIQGLVGFMYVQGVMGEPEPIRGGVVDKMAGMSGALAVVSALLHRSLHGGMGQEINVNMLDAYASYILPEFMPRFTYPKSEDKVKDADVFHMMKASDGFMIGLIQKVQLEATCKAFNREDLLTDPRFATAALVLGNQRALMAELSKVTSNLTKAEIFQKVLEYQLPLAPVNNFEEFFEDAQVKHNRCYVDVPDPELGPMRLINTFAKFGSTPAGIRSRPPKLGEQTEAIMSRLGFAASEISALRETKIIK